MLRTIFIACFLFSVFHREQYNLKLENTNQLVSEQVYCELHVSCTPPPPLLACVRDHVKYVFFNFLVPTPWDTFLIPMSFIQLTITIVQNVVADGLYVFLIIVRFRLQPCALNRPKKIHCLFIALIPSQLQV